MSEPRHVSRLHPSRGSVHTGGEGAGRVSSITAGSSMAFARSSGRGSVLHIDAGTIALELTISLLGLVMVTSASVSVASKESGETFFYLERQLLLMLMGGLGAVVVFCIPAQVLEKLSLPL